MCIHNICFHEEVRKICTWIFLLSGATTLSFHGEVRGKYSVDLELSTVQDLVAFGSLPFTPYLP